MTNVYCFKRNLDGSFEVPFFNPAPPEDLTRQANYTVVSSPDQAAKDGMNVKTLCHLGQFDFEKGCFHLLEKPDELIDLSVPYHQIMELRKNGN